MWRRRLLALLLFWPSSWLFAQNNQSDFSGVYLRNISPHPLDFHGWKGLTPAQIAAAEQFQKILDEGFPLVLVVSQTADEVAVTEIQNGVRSTSHYRFRGANPGKSSGARPHPDGYVRSKKDALVLDYTMEEVGPFGGTEKGEVHETWNLSPDVKTLTIRSTREGTETFTRQASLEDALPRAAEASLTSRCVCLRLPGGASPPANNKPANNEEGAALGFTVYRQLKRSIFFDAGVSADFFKDLQRTETPNGTIFRKSGQAISTFPEDVSLEISVWAVFSRSNFPMTVTAPLPAELFSLRFRVKWNGSSPRDLGELPSELTTEPFTELRSPGQLYRITVPAEGVPLDDSLEVHILTDAGTQIGCIRGSI